MGFFGQLYNGAKGAYDTVSGNDLFHPSRWKGDVFGRGDDGDSAAADRGLLRGQSSAAGAFADQGQAGFTQLGAEAAKARQGLQDQASGKTSVSAEQLRQALQQNLSGQRSMAASASPANAAMAARTAAIQSGNLGAGLAGQQAVAGLQERQQAQAMLNQMIMQQRQQELEAALQSRGNAITALQPGLQNPQKSWLEKYGPSLAAAAGYAAMSDRRLKTDITDADDESRKVIDGLKAYTFKYKDDKHGKGSQLGIMAQDLESAGLGHAVIETPQGKAVHGAKLATSNTAMIAALGKRVAELEAKKAA